jgi:hypothetical protein
VSDRRREDCNLRSWALADGETQSQSIVVSARGWLVVNPLGVAEPTVGWKRAPLSAVASIAELTSDKCFTHNASGIYMLSHMFIDL